MSQQQQKSVKVDAVARLQLFNCVHADCGATFTRKWRLEEHETTHTGARPFKCPVEGCARRFSRRSHLSRHALKHKGKLLRCSAASCTKTFSNKDKLKRHVRYAHGDKERYFQCTSPGCGRTFRKRRLLKLHQATHGISSGFRCLKAGCNATFRTHIARKAHEKTHTGYRCPHSQCPVVEHTWGKLLKHTAKHPASHTCSMCKKLFVKRETLRRHKRTHALQKPVLLCPSEGCQAYFSTTFNLQHHIRKVHLKLLRHRCSFPGCDKAFAMRESLIRHLLHHDPDAAKPRASLFTRLYTSPQADCVHFSFCLRGGRSAAVRAGRSVWKAGLVALWWRMTSGVSLLCACASLAGPSWRLTCPDYSTSARSHTTLTLRSTCVTSSTSNPIKRSKVKV
ncbi:P43 5S RNA-binding protein-like isoform X1 [Hemibagrus wyckioides]|uniref:P43 5S RNA-binding protein-like isoform X1 n=1 Tax=Hemibagrus wyckioides TaxID=337641 RepID=UPI00266C2465|nr:P43 5S RNA-binding protein-like isoform X1 [Hemibagrus wyckioides]